MKTYIIANWKMQLNESQSEDLAREIVRLWSAQGESHPEVEVVICASHVSLHEVGKTLNGTSVSLGAQDVFWEDKGAFTGEISPATLKELGAKYCIVGHSERREFLGETDQMVHLKVAELLEHNIDPIVCVGETKQEREDGRQDAVVIEQVETALKDIQPVGKQHIVIAYEPRWVIGTGQAVDPDEATAMHQLIRETMLEMLGQDVVERQTSVIYGGSIDPDNFQTFLDIDIIEGALVGGAALKAGVFVKLAEMAADRK